MILRLGGLIPLLKIVDYSTYSFIVKHGTWTISNLVRGRPSPKFFLVKEAIPVVCRIIMKENEDEIQLDACWALAYLSSMVITIKTVIETGVIPNLIKNFE